MSETTHEYFIQANSFAAPFFSDDSTSFQKARSPQEALEKFAKGYKHPCGLYAALCFASSDDFHKNKKPLAKWLCNHEIEKERLTKDKGCYVFLGHAPGKFEIDHVMHEVADPKGGRVLP